MNLDHEQKKIFWGFGVIERLANLGFLHGVPHHIPPDQIDLFLEIDNDRFSLFNSEQEFDRLFSFICVRCRIFEPDKVSIVKLLAKDYLNNRYKLIQFAYENNPDLRS